MRYITIIFFYLFIQNIAFSASVKNYSARYEIYHNNFYVGHTNRKLTKEKDFFVFSSVSETAGIASWFADITITETSKLKITNNNLTFYSFDYQINKNGKKESYQLNLKNAQQFYNSHKKQLFPVTQHLQDTHGFTVAIMYDLKNGKREMTYELAKKNKLDKYQLKFIKNEALATSSGKISTLKMEYFNPKKNQRVTIWCAPDMDFLPIRILNSDDNGDKNLLHLTHFNSKPVFLKMNEEDTE